MAGTNNVDTERERTYQVRIKEHYLGFIKGTVGIIACFPPF